MPATARSLVVLLAAWTGLAAGGAPAAPAADDANGRELRAWLQRVHDAAVHSNYVGTLVNWAGGTVTSNRVAHYLDAQRELERVDALDGESRGMLRVGDQVRTVWPKERVAIMEPRDPRATFPALVSGGEQRIPEFYELRSLPPERVAGHDAERMLLHARDHLRFDQMIWTDRASGLLLRVDTQNDGHTIESSAFSEVSIGVRPQPEVVLAALRQSEGYRQMRPGVERTRLDAEGWQLNGPLPAGFQPLGCVRRALPVNGPAGGDVRMLQAIFTDGLTHVSVFIEPYAPQRHKAAGLTVIGATHTLMRRSGDDWLTAVGDVPPPTLEKFLLLMERRK